jgi:membrane dipeptidase
MSGIAQPEPKIFADAKTRAFHEKTLVWDCLSLYYIIDEPYAQQALEGGVNVTNVTFGTEEDWETVLRNTEKGLQQIARSPLLKLATTADDVLAAQKEGKLAVIMGTQGSAFIEKDLYRVELLYRLGLRICGLAYTGGTLHADGCGEIRDGGLTFLGKELIDIVNGLPMLLDLSHCGHRTREEALQIARAPVCTHSNAYGLNANDRNTKDDTARGIVAKGGMLGVCGLPKTIWPQNANLDRLVDHIDYYSKLIGANNVGFGCDFVAAYKSSGVILPASKLWRTRRPDVFGTVDEFLTQSYPEGLTQIRELPNLTQRLFDRGYTEQQTAEVMGANWLRVFRNLVG